jgi:hypothetical protein
MLAGQLALRNQVTIPDAEQVVPDLVAWYKYANRHHRPLVGGPEHKAVEQIVAEHRRRLTHHDIAAKKAGTLPVLRQRHQDAVLIGRKRNGRLVVLLAANDGQIFVHRLEYLTTNLDEPASRTDWIAPGPEVARYTVLWQAERWATWRQGVSRADYLSGPEIQQTAASLAQDSETAFLVSFSAAKRTFTVWEMSERPEYSQDRPLTQRHHDVEVEATRQRWERKAGRIALHRGGSNNYSVRWDRSRFPWGDKHGQYDWEKDTVIWRDETKINSIFECRAQYEKFLKLERKLDSVARAIGMSIRQQWLERAEQTAKAEYIERYGDLSTWDDRQQQIHFPYTINTLHETDPRSGDVGVFVLYLVEAGLTVKGVTVAQARDKLQTTLGRPFKLPDDILDLKLA